MQRAKHGFHPNKPAWIAGKTHRHSLIKEIAMCPRTNNKLVCWHSWRRFGATNLSTLAPDNLCCWNGADGTTPLSCACTRMRHHHGNSTKEAHWKRHVCPQQTPRNGKMCWGRRTSRGLRVCEKNLAQQDRRRRRRRTRQLQDLLGRSHCRKPVAKSVPERMAEGDARPQLSALHQLTAAVSCLPGIHVH